MGGLVARAGARHALTPVIQAGSALASAES